MSGDSPVPGSCPSLPPELGPYRIRRELGRGGMGVVYVAEDSRLDREIAIKVLPGELMADERFDRRFEREAKLLASLNHPNIATIHSLERIDGIRFLTMELIPGQSLDRLLAEGPLSMDRALTIALQIARALESAHKQSVVHRDLKPANVQVTPDGDVKVLDFGLAFAVAGNAPGLGRLEGMGVMGTPGYMSLEQLSDGAVDARTDLFSFGCVLFECLSGRPAFRRESLQDSVRATFSADPDLTLLPEETPREIVDLIATCLMKYADGRTATAGEARRSIERDGDWTRRQVGIMKRDHASNRQGDALRVGDAAPAFALTNAHGERVSSEILLEDGPIVVCFYRGVW
jgi:eukaryotic-like serine/threonine-protein kinase